MRRERKFLSTLGKLLGGPPFGLLEHHMQQVERCIATMGQSLQALDEQRWDELESRADEVSRLEHEADQIKDEIRARLGRLLLMAVNRAQILEILSLQDTLADTAEDIAILVTIRRLKTPVGMTEDFRKFRDLNVATFQMARRLVAELHELAHTGFGGAEAEKIRSIVRDVAYNEHQVDVLQRQLLKRVLSDEGQLTAADITLWLQLIKELATLSNISEKLANRVQMMVDVK